MAQESPGSSSAAVDFKNALRAAILGVLLLTVLTGVLFPLSVIVLARVIFPRQAAGSLIEREGRVVGSLLIGQDFRGPGYFHPRPSAAGSGYDGVSSGGSNLGPLNPRLTAEVAALAAAYRNENGLAPESLLPADAVTRSGSGLDPHISPANAALQVARVARAQSLPVDVISRLVAAHTEPRQWLFLGEPRVNVLALNLALDRAAPAARRGETRERRQPARNTSRSFFASGSSSGRSAGTWPASSRENEPFRTGSCAPSRTASTASSGWTLNGTWPRASTPSRFSCSACSGRSFSTGSSALQSLLPGQEAAFLKTPMTPDLAFNTA